MRRASRSRSRPAQSWSAVRGLRTHRPRRHRPIIRADTDVPAAAFSIVAMLRGATLQWLADPTGIDMETVRREYQTALFHRYADC